jgi:LmbE family N-acetylglucosaminyl deacetylase
MKKNLKKNILVIAPHADDEVLGCGGSINKLSAKYNIYILVMTDANSGIPEKYSKNFSNTIKKQAIEAHKMLGVKKSIFFDFPILGLQNVKNYLIADKIKNLIDEVKPEIVFLPSKHDLCSDHRFIFEASIIVLRNPKLYNIKKILSYETPSESDWGNELIKSDRLNYFISLNRKNLSKKILAMKKFKSEYKLNPHPRSQENLEALARLRGSYFFSEFAEAFTVVKIID